MSTYYRPVTMIPLLDLLDGRLDQFGVRERMVPGETTEKERCLTDGRNHLWVHDDDHGSVSFTRYGANAPRRILEAIRIAFETEIVSEYEPQFWGFDTEEEWHAWQAEIAKKLQDESYVELMKYLRGEPNDILPGTNGEIEAKIAQELVHTNPDLMKEENKVELLKTVKEIWERDYVITVKLSDSEIAAAQMAVTHEDDLPQA